MFNWHNSNQIQTLDQEISNISSTCRIIYIKSENRDIISRCVDYSQALWDRLKLPEITKSKPIGKRFVQLEHDKLCCDLQALYEINGGPGYAGRKDLDPKQMESAYRHRLFFIRDFHLNNKDKQANLIKMFLEAAWSKDALLLVSSPYVSIPAGFNDNIEVVCSRLIGREDIFLWLSEEVRGDEQSAIKNGWKIQSVAEEKLRDYALQFVGLSEGQIENVLYRLRAVSPLYISLGTKQMTDLINKEKLRALEKEPCIRILEAGGSVGKKPKEAAGMDYYTEEWLPDRVDDFHHPEESEKMGTPAPKGVLLCGVPGTGKTLMARQTALRLGDRPGQSLPLIQFQLNRLQSSKFGETEEKLARFLEQIGAYAPCVMLIDEIEKSFHVDQNNGGGMHEVKMQMLGQLLDWMQNRKDNVFTFITANNINQLPPELLRDGRLSGRFFAGMPCQKDLSSILRLRLSDLAENGLFEESFAAALTSDKEPVIAETKAALGRDVFDEIARQGEEKKRRPFMTGANLEALIENTNRELRKKKASMPYSREVYLAQMVECAVSERFVPQGQSNLHDIASLWLRAQKNQYQSVSKTDLLPMNQFEGGEFVGLTATDNAYDEYLRRVLREEIQRQWKEADQQRKAYERMAEKE